MNNSEKIIFKKFHAGQTAISRELKNRRFCVMRAGRRFGKTTMLEELGAHRACKGLKVGWFAPSYKLMIPTYKRTLKTVRPLIETHSKTDALITLQTGGEFEFWSLDNEDAGRSRSYDLVIIDEGSLKKKGLREVWEQAIKPTLLDRGGRAIMAGTPKGMDDEDYFHTACTDKAEGWHEFHAPTWNNPTLDAASVARLKEENSPLVWQQEYCADFVDWSGSAFFSLQSFLHEGQPVEPTMNCDAVFATLDTATKTGKEHDGTAVIYWAVSKFHGYKLVMLDWDIVQIEGALLETWLPNVYKNLEAYAVELRARSGSIGCFIEDKASGMILLQQARRRGWAAHAIDSKLTSVGKDERCISVSGYIYRGMVKISRHAFNKTVNYKGITRNHLVTQVCGFRVGVDNGADDITDCMTYGVAIALGNNEGY